MNKQKIIVFSHLRWGFVRQRPQHILSRLSRFFDIYFIEETMNDVKAVEPFIIHNPEPNVHVLTPTKDTFFSDLKSILEMKNIKDAIFWFYSPTFVNAADEINHSLVIYDCMDELSAFKNPPPLLLNKEKKLLQIADIVFTGGKSLYAEKKKYHSNTFCFPSSVDAIHFQKAKLGETPIPLDIAKIPTPRVGFIGVIDERMDMKLLEKAAFYRPNYSFVLMGPVVKIPQSDIPQNHNIYHLGQKEYKDLPCYLKSLDVAMMPFALNRSTQFISPTKTLEFIAAGKPIVSTPIYDVVRDYSHIIPIVDTPEEFDLSLDQLITEPPDSKAIRLSEYDKVLNKTSWDKTVSQMKEIIDISLDKEEGRKAGFFLQNGYL